MILEYDSLTTGSVSNDTIATMTVVDHLLCRH